MSLNPVSLVVMAFLVCSILLFAYYFGYANGCDGHEAFMRRRHQRRPGA